MGLLDKVGEGIKEFAKASARKKAQILIQRDGDTRQVKISTHQSLRSVEDVIIKALEEEEEIYVR